MKWGIEEAMREAFDVGVEASTMGAHLYEHLGFVLKETRKVQVEGEKAFLETKIMVFDSGKRGLEKPKTYDG